MDMNRAAHGQPGVNVFKQAAFECEAGPGSEVRRVGGATYQVRWKCGPRAAHGAGDALDHSVQPRTQRETMAERLAAE